MAQTVPIDAYLGANRTGLAIGATLYLLDGSTSHAAFSTSSWYEAPAGSGAWHHAGLSLPDAGGVVAVGVSGTEYMRVAVEARQLLYSEYTAPANSGINDIQSRLPAALVGGRIDANVGAISSDATAADNAEAFFDGTGYAGTNNVIPTVTTVTNAVSANVTQISGDATAADNLEAALDGTGGVTITAGLTGNVTGNLSGSVGSVVGDVGGSVASVTAGVSLADGAITAAKIAADAITDAKVASDVTIAAVTGAVGSVTGNVGGNVVGSVGSVAGAVGSVSAGVTVTTNNDKSGYGLVDGAITSAKFGAGAITAAAIATGAIDADALSNDAVTAIQSGLATPTNITAGTITTVTNLTNAPTNGDLTATMKASVTTAASAATPTVTAGTVTDKTGYSLSSAGIQAIWDALTSALTTAGSIGRLFVDNINATISSRSSHTATNVRTEMDSNSTQLAKLGTPAGASLSADVAAIKADTAAILLDTGTDGVVVASASKGGYSLAADQSSVTVGTVNALGTTAQAQVNTQADTALADYDAPTKAELDAAQAAIIDAVPTTAEIDTQLSGTHGAGGWGAAGGLTAADIWGYSSRTLTAATNNVTVVSAVNGGVITLYAKDTWRFTINNTSLALSGYEAIAFVIKSSESVSDSGALLYVRSDSGLEYINATDATAGDGTLTIDSATQITVNISIAVTDVASGRYRWWIKGFDTTPTPDTGFTLAAGVCLILPAGLRAIA